MGNEVTFWVFSMGNTIVSAHTSVLPTDQQWDEYIGVAKKMYDQIGLPALTGLVFTDGGAPTGRPSPLLAQQGRRRATR